MTKFQDLSGMIFGKLKVIERGIPRPYSGGMTTMWIVECSCNRSSQFSVSATHLKSGHTKQCLKCSYEVSGQKKRSDISGQVFGNLTATRFGKIEKNVTYWYVICSCGRSKEYMVRLNNLTSGNSTCCKICQNEKISKRSISDISGMKFGRLFVISFYGSTENSKTAIWECLCDCGNKINVIGASLVSGHTKSCGCLRESYIASELKKYFKNNFEAISEYKIFKNPKTNLYLPYDIYIPYGENPELNGFYIEVHGGQHYEFISWWHKNEEKFKNQKYRDKLKKSFANKNGTYIEIDLRKINTKDKAIQYIEKIIKKVLSK